jgi:uncharacterized protein YjbJ (UPF0337 family)
MDQNIIGGKWRELKGMARQEWGKLRHDEFAQLEGKKDRLVGKLQQTAGRASDEAARGADDLARHQDPTAKV